MDAGDRRLAAGLVVALTVAALASVAWPLATYTITLAAFGLAHVLSELRYVDLRFGRRLGRALAVGMGAVLLGVASVRLASIAGVLCVADAVRLELGGGLALAALVLPSLLARGGAAGGLGAMVAAGAAAGVAAGLAAAIVLAPSVALLTIAVLHNFTPAGFIYEATAGRRRRRAMALVGLVFVALPALIAAGCGWSLVTALGVAAPEASPLGYGPLQEAMRAYLPLGLDPMLALHLFSACVFLQCTHYAAVLVVMPRWLGPRDRGWLPWPRRGWWIALGASGLAVVPFALDFVEARRGYGVLASIHAWIELPILLLALFGPHASRSRP